MDHHHDMACSNPPHCPPDFRPLRPPAAPLLLLMLPLPCAVADAVRTSADAAAREQLAKVVEVLAADKVASFEDCIAWARLKFQVHVAMHYATTRGSTGAVGAVGHRAAQHRRGGHENGCLPWAAQGAPAHHRHRSSVWVMGCVRHRRTLKGRRRLWHSGVVAYLGQHQGYN